MAWVLALVIFTITVISSTRTTHFFIHRGFIHPHHFGPTFIVVDRAPRWVWVPGFWHWNAFQWVWVSDHWAW